MRGSFDERHFIEEKVMDEGCMKPRDVVKLAFQYQETEHVPYTFDVSPEQEEALTEYYGDDSWRDKIVWYMGGVSGVDNFLSM